MQSLKLIFTVMLASVTLMTAGCSKKESETTSTPSPTPAEPTAVGKTETPAPVHPTPQLPAEVRPTTPATTSATTPTPPAVVPPPIPEETPAQLAAQVKQLESTYHNTPEFQKRVAIIYDLSSVESPETIDAIGHLFLAESDKELKIELVNSLTDVDGENDKKLTILTVALRADQPKDVRLEAIDALVDTEDKRAIQVLQGLSHDPDEEIRDAVQDAIEQLQADTVPPQQPK
jgi:hypothetical protein